MIRESTDVDRSVVSLSDENCDEYMCETRYLYGVKTRIVERTSFLGLKTLSEEVNERVYCPKHQGDSLDLVKDAREKEHIEAKRNLNKHRKRQNEEEIQKIIDESILPVFRFSHECIERPNDDIVSVEVGNFKKAIGMLERCSNEHPIFLYSSYDEKYCIINPGCMNGSRFEEYDTKSRIIADQIEDRYDSTDFNRYEYQVLRSNQISGKKVPDSVHQINLFEGVELEDMDIYDEEVFNVDISECTMCGSSMWSSDCKYICLNIDGEKRLVVVHDVRDCGKIMGEINPIFSGGENYAPIK